MGPCGWSDGCNAAASRAFTRARSAGSRSGSLASDSSSSLTSVGSILRGDDLRPVRQRHPRQQRPVVQPPGQLGGLLAQPLADVALAPADARQPQRQQHLAAQLAQRRRQLQRPARPFQHRRGVLPGEPLQRLGRGPQGPARPRLQLHRRGVQEVVGDLGERRVRIVGVQTLQRPPDGRVQLQALAAGQIAVQHLADQRVRELVAPLGPLGPRSPTAAADAS